MALPIPLEEPVTMQTGPSTIDQSHYGHVCNILMKLLSYYSTETELKEMTFYA